MATGMDWNIVKDKLIKFVKTNCIPKYHSKYSKGIQQTFTQP